MRLQRFGFLGILVLLALPFLPRPAAALDGAPAACENQSVLNRIAARFRYQVRNVPHLPDVSIVEFGLIHQTRYLPYSDEFRVARRYCHTTALLSDGRTKPVWYLIEDGLGFVGLGDNVEFCVLGFDRWMVYNGLCRVLR